MRAPLVVIGEIITEKPFEMAFVEDDDVIQTLPENAADDALGIGILPRAPRRGRAFLHPQTAHAFSKLASIDSITIAQQVLRRGSTPVVAEAFVLPRQDCPRLNQEQGLALAAPHARNHRPEQPITR